MHFTETCVYMSLSMRFASRTIHIGSVPDMSNKMTMDGTGDQIGHLLWRLEHGDLPELHQPKVVVVMIGINDLGAAADCSQGVTDVITKAADGVNDRSEPSHRESSCN